MNKQIAVLILSIGLFFSGAAFADSIWKRADLNPALSAPLTRSSQYIVYAADEGRLKAQLFSLLGDPVSAQILELPMPDGTMKLFRVWQTPMMPDQLSAEYPGIKTFTGELVGNPTVTAKLDFTYYGFHSMIFDGNNTSFIDPYDNSNSGYYVVHYKRDEARQWSEQAPQCLTKPSEQATQDRALDISHPKNGFKTVNGYQFRTYRLALSCSYQYANAVTSITTPLKSQVFSKMTTSINRINGVFERELSVTLNFVANENLLIDTAAAADTFNLINGDANSCIVVNQAVCDTRIGSANYDIGHVFTTGAGGLSSIGIVCTDGAKAQSATGQPVPYGDGFDIDYVVHEMGHELGADHPFNNNLDGSCGGNGVREIAYEPGSGSTIMAYAGICYPDDIQAHSDDYFHAVSLKEIQAYITKATGGDACPVKTPTGNKPVYVAPFATLYNIPYRTPFELTAPTAVDSVADTSVTYCWEQWDLGDFGIEFVDAHQYGPIFRSYRPAKSPVRVFPKIGMVLAGVLSDAGMEKNQGEKAPDTARILTFKLTMRDIYQGKGCFLIPDDSIVLNVINTHAGFKVTSQNDSGATYVGGSLQNVTWDVVTTNTGVINTPNVDIYMSADSGYTWPYHIGTFPNTGSASVPLPNPDTSIAKARIKVKGNNNVFFNVNKYNFGVTHSDVSDSLINVYPVPTHSTLRIFTGNKGEQQFVIFNSVGKKMFSGTVSGIYDLQVNLWPRGVYIIKLVDDKKHRTIKKFVVD